MLTLIDRFEKMGRAGAPPALGLALILFLVSAFCVQAFVAADADAAWTAIWLPIGAAMLAFALAVVFAMFGVRLATRNNYESVDDLFPSLDRDAFLRVVRHEPRPICVCTQCRIFVPAQFSTGGCPKCTSSVNYYQIDDDEDAKMAIAATA